jgi:hypothetical protein
LEKWSFHLLRWRKLQGKQVLTVDGWVKILSLDKTQKWTVDIQGYEFQGGRSGHLQQMLLWVQKDEPSELSNLCAWLISWTRWLDPWCRAWVDLVFVALSSLSLCSALRRHWVNVWRWDF